MDVETAINMIIEMRKSEGWITTPEEEADLEERLWRAASRPMTPNEENSEK